MHETLAEQEKERLHLELAVQLFRPYCYSNVDVNVNLWYHWIYSMVDKYTPKRTKKRQKYPPMGIK